MKMTKKLGTIFLGIVLGLDLCSMSVNDQVFKSENLIMLFAVLAIVFGFNTSKLFLQISQFSCSIILGVALREYAQMPMHVCLYVSMATIAIVVAAIIANALAIDWKKKDGRYVSKGYDIDDMYPEDDYEDEELEDEEDTEGTEAEENPDEKHDTQAAQPVNKKDENTAQ